MGRLHRVVRRFRNRVLPGKLILLYHRVAEVDSDPWELCVSPSHFAEHLEVLTRLSPRVCVRSIRGLVDAHDARPAVAITFDDGYADNLYQAKPLLERHAVPATVFLTTGAVGSPREFWWDELDRILLRPHSLPQTLHLTIQGRHYGWMVGEYSQPQDSGAPTHAHTARESAPTTRHSLYCAIWQLLQPLQDDERKEILNRLVEWAELPLEGRPTHRVLSAEEVLALADSELIELGSHTVTHSALADLPLALQREEIRCSKAHLEQMLGSGVTSFSYPYGIHTPETVALVREAGFLYACTSQNGAVRRRTDRYRLPRLNIENWDGEKLARKLAWFLS